MSFLEVSADFETSKFSSYYISTCQEFLKTLKILKIQIKKQYLKELNLIVVNSNNALLGEAAAIYQVVDASATVGS